MVWRGKRSLSLDRLIEVAEYLEKTSRDVDIANLSGSVTCVAGGILSLIGIILAFFTFGASLGVTAAGTALAIGGAVTSTGAVIADGAITNSQNKVVDAIMEEDKRASQKLNGVLERIGVTSDRLDIWAQEHPQSVSPRTRDVLDRVRVMCGVFCTIRKIKRFSVAAKESLSAVKAAGRVIHATDECVTFTSHSGEGAMSAGAVLSMADDAVLAGGRQGARLAGSGSRAAASEAAAISSGAIVLNTLAMAVDIGMIAYLSYRIHNGSESERAQDIRSKVSLLEREKRALREVYECCEKFLWKEKEKHGSKLSITKIWTRGAKHIGLDPYCFVGRLTLTFKVKFRSLIFVGMGVGGGGGWGEGRSPQV